MTKTKKLWKALLGATALTAFTAVSAQAAGTAAGTDVQNTFTLNYEVNNVPQDEITNDGLNGNDAPTSFTVDRVIDLNVDSTTDTNVTPGQTNQALSYTLTNEGNDTQQYDLNVVNEAVNAPIVGFDVTPYTVWYEDPATPGTFIEFTGANYPELAPDQTINVEIRGDIPTAANDGEQEILSLVATTLDTTGTVVTNDTDGNTITGAAENVFADDPASAEASTGDSTTVSDGNDSATAAFIVATAEITGGKEVEVFSQDGSNCTVFPGTATGGYAIPGSCVEYTITVQNTGGEDATNVVVFDELDANLTLVALDSTGFTGGAFDALAMPLDCTGGVCDVNFTGATLASGTTATPTVGTVVIRALVK